jgi:branched-chain amino acid transport system permease protein
MVATTTPRTAPGPVELLVRQHRLRWYELLPWVTAISVYVLLPEYLSLGANILIMVLFALSLDLILGYAGIVTLGHAAFYGLGAYTAGILGARGWSEPLSGLLAAGALSALLGAVSGAIILRTRGLTLLMLTLAILFMLQEAANKAGFLTGGADGLQGVTIDPILGLFRFDMFGRTAYLYCLIVVFAGWLLARQLVHSPFGRSLTGIRENVARMHAIGADVQGRLITVYTIAAAMAGIAGGLQAQTTQFAALSWLSFDTSGAILIMLILGGSGRLYGAFIGAPLYMIAQNFLSRIDPAYWFGYLGVFLILVVMFARGGILGLLDQAVALLRRRA